MKELICYQVLEKVRENNKINKLKAQMRLENKCVVTPSLQMFIFGNVHSFRHVALQTALDALDKKYQENDKEISELTAKFVNL